MEIQINSIFNPIDKLAERTLDETKYFIYPPYSVKDDVKALGGKWDVISKKWYILDKKNELFELYRKVYIKNIYDKKEFYKANNGHWDYNNKIWITYASNEILKPYFSDLIEK